MVIITLIVYVAHSGFAHKFWVFNQYPTQEARELSRLQALVGGVIMMVYTLSLLLGRALANYGCLETVHLECIVVFSVICFTAVLALATKHYLARLFGYDQPEAVWGVELAGTDASLLLFLDTAVTALHLLVPVRWVVLVPMEVLTIFMYVVPAYALVSPSIRDVPSNTIALLVLTVMAGIGKRTSERQERAMFAGLLAEKRKRFQAEFQLSTWDASNKARPDDAHSEMSLPETTLTGRAFEAEGHSNMKEIRSIGEKEQWLIPNSEVEVMPNGVLGAGGFGVVMKALYYNTVVAVKAPKGELQNQGRLNKCLPELCNELRILRRLRHPNIVFLYGACVDTKFERLCLVLEFVDGRALGSFVHWLQSRSGGDDSGCEAGCRSPDSHVRAQIAFDIVSALRYLHSRTPVVVHGDLKDANVFVEECRDRGDRLHEHRAKLLDFGLSRVVTRSAKPLRGTVRWMAPELFSRQSPPPDRAADVYSVGQLIYFIAVGKRPFGSKRVDEVLKWLRRGRPPSLTWPAAEVGSSDMTQSCRTVVEQCVQPEPALRPTIQQVSEELSELLDDFHSDGGDRESSSEQAPATRALATQDVVSGRTSKDVRPAASNDSPPQEFRGLVEVRRPGHSRGVGLGIAGGSLPAVQEFEVLQPLGRSQRSRSSSSQGRPSSSSGVKDLASPAYEPTPMESKKLSLVFLLLRWNCSCPADACCWLHSSLQALDDVVLQLRRRRCTNNQQDDGFGYTGQCQSCKMLLINGQRTCDFCSIEQNSCDVESTEDSGRTESMTRSV